MTEQDKQALIKHFCSRDCGEAAKDCTIMPCHEIELIQEFQTTEPDSDTISRRAAITQLSHNKRKGDEEWELAVANDIRTIWKLPPAQPEIIYCKDCKKHNKHYHESPYKDTVCPLTAWRGKARGHEFDYQFCAYAERREVTT